MQGRKETDRLLIRPIEKSKQRKAFYHQVVHELQTGERCQDYFKQFSLPPSKSLLRITLPSKSMGTSMAMSLPALQ